VDRFNLTYRYIIALGECSVWYNPVVNLLNEANKKKSDGSALARGSFFLSLEYQNSWCATLRTGVRFATFIGDTCLLRNAVHAHFYRNLRREASLHMFPGSWITRLRTAWLSTYIRTLAPIPVCVGAAVMESISSKFNLKA